VTSPSGRRPKLRLSVLDHLDSRSVEIDDPLHRHAAGTVPW